MTRWLTVSFLASMLTSLGPLAAYAAEAADPKEPKGPPLQSKNHEDPNYGWYPGRVPTPQEIALVEKLVAGSPNDFQLVRKLGKGYFYRHWQAGDKDAGRKAIEMLERALKLKKDDPETLAFMGITLRITGDGTDSAGRNSDQCFRLAEKIDPNNMGVIGLQLGLNAKNDRGVELAERMRRLPDFAQLPPHGRQRALLTLGWGAARKGDAKQARAFFQEGLDIDATTPEAVTLKQELAKLK